MAAGEYETILTWEEVFGRLQVEEQSGATWHVGQLVDMSPSDPVMLAFAG